MCISIGIRASAVLSRSLTSCYEPAVAPHAGARIETDDVAEILIDMGSPLTQGRGSRFAMSSDRLLTTGGALVATTGPCSIFGPEGDDSDAVVSTGAVGCAGGASTTGTEATTTAVAFGTGSTGSVSAALTSGGFVSGDGAGTGFGGSASGVGTATGTGFASVFGSLATSGADAGRSAGFTTAVATGRGAGRDFTIGGGADTTVIAG